MVDNSTLFIGIIGFMVIIVAIIVAAILFTKDTCGFDSMDECSTSELYDLIHDNCE